MNLEFLFGPPDKAPRAPLVWRFALPDGQRVELALDETSGTVEVRAEPPDLDRALWGLGLPRQI